MPLNIQDSEERKKAPPGSRAGSPPLPDGGKRGGVTKLLLWILALVVIASAFFLLIQFGVIPGGRESKGSPGPADAPAVDSTRPQGAPADSGSGEAIPAGRKSESEKAAELRQRLAGNRGDFTIFISAFSSAADAQELSGRWERAGYPSFVQHSGGWYRVGLGRYASVGSAREEAEKLRQALEEGYWIGSAAADETL